MNNTPSSADDGRQRPHGGQPAAAASEATLRRLGDALQGLRFGSVLAIVQDGVVVQIERTEKTRFTR
ncbi:MAG: YezD family protein [Pirellulales bacterium]